MSLEQELEFRTEFSAKYSDTLLIYSDRITDWSLLSDNFQKLKETWQLRFLYPHQKLIALREQPQRKHSMAPLSEKSAATIGFLKKGLYTKAVVTWNLFIQELKDKRYATTKVALINIANAVLKLAWDDMVLDTTYEEACMSFQRTIENLSDIQQLNTMLDDLFKKITNHVQTVQLTIKKSTIQEISNFLSQNYTDRLISTKSIADEFHMSPAYLSRIYRRCKGHSLMQEINILRIQKAKECLSNPSCLIKDIPQHIGMENLQYFYQLFKKLTGKTPKEYQKDIMIKYRSASAKDRSLR